MITETYTREVKFSAFGREWEAEGEVTVTEYPGSREYPPDNEWSVNIGGLAPVGGSRADIPKEIEKELTELAEMALVEAV